jgi:hypothetical protein
MSQSFVRSSRLAGLAEAFRFARIPFVCAAVVALVSADPVGRTLAIVLALGFVVSGIAMNARQIFAGRDAQQPTAAPTTYQTRRAA